MSNYIGSKDAKKFASRINSLDDTYAVGKTRTENMATIKEYFINNNLSGYTNRSIVDEETKKRIKINIAYDDKLIELQDERENELHNLPSIKDKRAILEQHFVEKKENEALKKLQEERENELHNLPNINDKKSSLERHFVRKKKEDEALEKLQEERENELVGLLERHFVTHKHDPERLNKINHQLQSTNTGRINLDNLNDGDFDEVKKMMNKYFTDVLGKEAILDA